MKRRPVGAKSIRRATLSLSHRLIGANANPRGPTTRFHGVRRWLAIHGAQGLAASLPPPWSKIPPAAFPLKGR